MKNNTLKNPKMSEFEYFVINKARFLGNPKIKGKFVAIFKGEIIAMSKDKLKLINTIFTKKWSHPPFIIKVEDDDPVLTMITPI